jgi:hypothetical protein
MDVTFAKMQMRYEFTYEGPQLDGQMYLQQGQEQLEHNVAGNWRWTNGANWWNGVY